MLETYDTYDGSTESDEDRLLDGLMDTYDALVPPPFDAVELIHSKRPALLIKDKTRVLTALKILRKNSSEREGTMYHQQGMQVASRLAPEIVHLFKIGDVEIQV